MPLERSQVEQIIKRYGIALKKRGIKPERLILFGSYAKGKASEFSDIDLLVISSDFSGIPLIERCAILGRAAAEIMEPVEALAYTPEEIERLLPTSIIGATIQNIAEHVEIPVS